MGWSGCHCFFFSNCRAPTLIRENINTSTPLCILLPSAAILLCVACCWLLVLRANWPTLLVVTHLKWVPLLVRILYTIIILDCLVSHVFINLLCSQGNHNCVAVISNYVPEEEVMCFTVSETVDGEPQLPLALAKPVHKFIMMVFIIITTYKYISTHIVYFYIFYNFNRPTFIQWKWRWKYLRFF